MKCPMLTMYAVTYSKPEAYQDRDCIQEECAWWDGHGGFCSILKIARHLAMVAPTLGDIAKELTLTRPSRR